jgi:hypothetical protein
LILAYGEPTVPQDPLPCLPPFGRVLPGAFGEFDRRTSLSSAYGGISKETHCEYSPREHSGSLTGEPL